MISSTCGEILSLRLRGRDGIAAQAAVHDDERVGPFERGDAGDHLVEDRAEAVDVGAGIAAFAFDLFGGHVVGRAHGRA